MISWLVGDEQMNAIFKKNKTSQAGRLKNVASRIQKDHPMDAPW